jgi:hypothetical protein
MRDPAVNVKSGKAEADTGEIDMSMREKLYPLPWCDSDTKYSLGANQLKPAYKAIY